MKTMHTLYLLLVPMIVFMGCSKPESTIDFKRDPLNSTSTKDALTPDNVTSENTLKDSSQSNHQTLTGTLSSEESLPLNTNPTRNNEVSTCADSLCTEQDCITELKAREIARQAVSSVVGIDSNVTIKTEIRDEYYVFEFSKTNSVDFIRKVVVDAKSGSIKYIWLPAQ